MRVLCFLAVVLAAGCSKPAPKAEPGLPYDNSWGTPIDPDRDCRFESTPDGGLAIGLPGRDKDLSIERNRMNGPRVLRAVSGDFTATVRVRGVFQPSLISLAPDRPSFIGAGLFLTTDDRTYVRLERAVLSQGGGETAYASWELRQDGRWTRQGNTGEMRLADADTWLRLTRQGNVLRGEVSQDGGTTYRALPDMAVVLPADVWIGVAAVTTGTTSFHPTFDRFTLDPLR